MFDPLTLLATFAPVVVRAGNALVQRFIAPDAVKPTSVAEVVQLQQLELERFRVLQDADKGGATYQWVEAVRKLQRPAVVIGLGVAFLVSPDSQNLANMFSVVTFYLFGERVPYIGGKK